MRASKYLVLISLFLSAAFADGVTVLFDPSNPQIGPFPADSLTVADPAQITGRRVNLPLPDCTAQPALCAALALVNQFDGFNIRPQIRVTFSGPIDTSTLRNGIFFVALDNVTSTETGLQQPGDTVAINQVTWDPAANSAYAKPDDALDQHRHYALVVTDAVQDISGNPLTPDPAFTKCVQTPDPTGYCPDLMRALAAVPVRFGASHVVGASIFTTMSVTAWLESARRQLQCLPIVTRHPDGQYVFNVPDISNLAVNFDIGSGQFSTLSLPISSPSFSILFGSLGRLAFGSFLSPLVLNEKQLIDPLASGSEVALPTPSNEVSFHVYLPNTPPPSNGYPVVIFAHGLGDSSIGGPTVIAPALAQSGFATIAINAFGHGFGPATNFVVTANDGTNTTLSLGGRGIDRNADGVIESSEGCFVLTPLPIGFRDCFRQTVVDLMQLVRVIRAGLDIDGDGAVDLDGSRIYFAGQSLGSMYGTILNAVEPSLRAAVFNVGGGPLVDIIRWSSDFSSTASALLASQDPPLLPPGTPFIDNFPFRDQPVAIDPPGASQTASYLELLEWLDSPGDPFAFAPHLVRSPLGGITARPVLFQMARADRTVPNPASTDLIRAAGLADSTWVYRHDLAQQAFPGLPENPHTYLTLFLGTGGANVALPSLPALLIGLAAQSQISGFLVSDGAAIPDMGQIFPGPFFEIPAQLPNDLGYSQ